MENVNARNLSVEAPMGSGPWCVYEAGGASRCPFRTPSLHDRYVANVFEELDAPGVVLYDPGAGGAGGRLYVFYNATPGTPRPPSFSLVATAVRAIF